jgi:hypothetical protein
MHRYADKLGRYIGGTVNPPVLFVKYDGLTDSNCFEINQGILQWEVSLYHRPPV